MDVSLKNVSKEDVSRLTALLHDAKVISLDIADSALTMTMNRAGFEHGYLASKGWLGLGRRWMYPWVECILTIAPIGSSRRKDSTLTEDGFDDLMSLRIDGPELIVHRTFSDAMVELLPETVVRLRDTGSAVDRKRGLVVMSSRALDLSYVSAFLQS